MTTHTHSRRAATRPEALQRFTTATIAEAMQLAGIAPDLVYAFRKTGFIPTDDTIELLSAAELAEWDAAIDEFERKKSKTKGAGA